MKPLIVSLLFCGCLPALGGPYAPAQPNSGTTAVHKDSPAITRWASAYTNYIPGEDVDALWQTPALALGPALGGPYDVVSLGRGGEITLEFDPPIANDHGDDFAVFENSFSHSFLEFAFVEVSSDGVHFVRFPNDSLSPSPTSFLDASNVTGLAGKYIHSYGTPFNLSALPPTAEVDRSAIRYIRLIDVVGGVSANDDDLPISLDSSGDPIYDPYPTFGSAGFDLDAIGALNNPITILSTEKDGDSFSFTWESEAGLSYRVESTSNPSQGWQTHSTVTPTASTHTTTVPLTAPGLRFFRVTTAQQ